MSAFYHKDSDGTIAACPDCESVDLSVVRKGSDAEKKYFDHWFNRNLESLYHDKYATHDRHMDPMMVCDGCLENWFNDNWTEYESDNPENHGFWSDYLGGMFPASHASKIDSEGVKPDFTTYCKAPKPCHCGKCPDPNQLKFDLGEAGKAWYE
jgi:hypothetical protein